MTHDNEAAIIGAVLRDGTQYVAVKDIVGADHFAKYPAVWQAFGRLDEHGLGIDVVTTGDELERVGDEVGDGVLSGRALLSKLRSEGEPRNIMSYAENLQDAYVKNRLTPFFAKCGYWAQNGRRAKDILLDVNTELGKITLFSSQDEHTVSMAVAAQQAFDKTDAASKDLGSVVQTGIIELDRMLGGLFEKEFYIVAGRPGQGKSALLLTVARNAARRGKRVLVFSLETGGARVAQRLIAQEAEVDLHDIVTGKMGEQAWAKYVAATEKVSSWPITINDLSSISIQQIRQVARKTPCDLILVDYIQLADSGEKRTERRELEVSAVSRGLKHLAGELGVPVFAAAQLSRAVEARAEKRPILSDLRESGSLEQDASVVMFIYHEKDTEIIVGKNRDGAVGSVPVIWNAKWVRFDSAAFQRFAPNE